MCSCSVYHHVFRSTGGECPCSCHVREKVESDPQPKKRLTVWYDATHFQEFDLIPYDYDAVKEAFLADNLPNFIALKDDEFLVMVNVDQIQRIVF